MRRRDAGLLLMSAAGLLWPARPLFRRDAMAADDAVQAEGPAEAAGDGAPLAGGQGLPRLPDGLLIEGEDRVAAVIDGDTVDLADGTQVRLVGIQAPKRALGRRGFVPWPLSEEAAARLEALALGRAVGLAYGGAPIDRHGRRLAHLVRSEDGVWIQGAMVAAGFARAYANFADNRGGLAVLLSLEAAARAARRGIWADPFYAVRRADRLSDADLDGFQLVEGTVLAVGRAAGRVFLNFGADWATDFTATIQPEDREAFENEQGEVDLSRLEGRRVRLRGWLTWRDGPAMDLVVPEQIELLGPGGR